MQANFKYIINKTEFDCSLSTAYDGIILQLTNEKDNNLVQEMKFDAQTFLPLSFAQDSKNTRRQYTAEMKDRTDDKYTLLKIIKTSGDAYMQPVGHNSKYEKIKLARDKDFIDFYQALEFGIHALEPKPEKLILKENFYEMTAKLGYKPQITSNKYRY